jgi:hypothetical protein
MLRVSGVGVNVGVGVGRTALARPVAGFDVQLRHPEGILAVDLLQVLGDLGPPAQIDPLLVARITAGQGDDDQEQPAHDEQADPEPPAARSGAGPDRLRGISRPIPRLRRLGVFDFVWHVGNYNGARTWNLAKVSNLRKVYPIARIAANSASNSS